MADHLHQWEVKIVTDVNIHHLAIHGYPTHDAEIYKLILYIKKFTFEESKLVLQVPEIVNL